ncbi:uncharacterized protein LAJ45_02133 [Morchella importuna]|uniref:uncharacterized protein n=1 Tax=Morchella importuna TaxID=1174673 RepID=UPI001E8CDAC7|nr:uncharacterized protein LAJ45_02133 [Morchella importuna]KAH8154365.1 hypothetical protein LAJ45_02133 [Morchella importuna]
MGPIVDIVESGSQSQWEWGHTFRRVQQNTSFLKLGARTLVAPALTNQGFGRTWLEIVDDVQRGLSSLALPTLLANCEVGQQMLRDVRNQSIAVHTQIQSFTVTPLSKPLHPNNEWPSR